MSIPSNHAVRRVMEILVERHGRGRNPLVANADLMAACGLSSEEFQAVVMQFYELRLFTNVGPQMLQVAPFVQDYAPRLSHCTLDDVRQFAQSYRSRHVLQRLLPIMAAAARDEQPAVTLKAILEYGDRVDDGTLIEAVAVPWFEIIQMIRRDPQAIYQIDPWKWEEIIAGAYTRAGFDEVVLTPRSGDKGRDVIATKRGFGSIRFFDQVKAYKPGNLVTAEEVRAMLGVITGAGNVSKGVITTTSEFAPRIASDDFIRPFIPYRLELKARADLLTWLDSLAADDRPVTRNQSGR